MTKRLTTEQRLTPERLEAIRKRAEAATSGPWYESSGYVDSEETGDTIADIWADGDNAEFIAEARTDIPALLAEVERLRSAISESLAVHKWNNEESAVILEKALEYEDGIDESLGEHYVDIAEEAEAMAND